MEAILRITVLAAAFIFLGVLVLQYPLSTTFPIGGDATKYILKLTEVTTATENHQWSKALIQLLTNTRYPGTQVILATSMLLPISWPERLTWWIVLGHLFSGIALSTLLYRLSGWQSAAAGIALFALAGVGVTFHIESGTLAQLWSLGFIALTLHQIARGSLLGAIVMTIVTALVHPLSSAIMITSLAVATPALFLIRSWRFAALGAAAGLTGALLAIRYYQASTDFLTGGTPFPIIDILRSSLGPFLLLAPIGIGVLFRSRKNILPHQVIITTFILIAVLLTLNSQLGIPVLTHRFRSYGIIATLILSALALPAVLRMALPTPVIRSLVIGLLFISSGLSAWHDAAAVFKFYESPSNYARLHPDEKAAIDWMRVQLPPKSVVVSTRANRHSEWIPILSGHSWIGLTESDELWRASQDELASIVATKPYTHVVFFRHREKASELWPAGLEAFQTVFENKGAIILELKKP